MSETSTELPPPNLLDFDLLGSANNDLISDSNTDPISACTGDSQGFNNSDLLNDFVSTGVDPQTVESVPQKQPADLFLQDLEPARQNIDPIVDEPVHENGEDLLDVQDSFTPDVSTPDEKDDQLQQEPVLELQVEPELEPELVADEAPVEMAAASVAHSTPPVTVQTAQQLDNCISVPETHTETAVLKEEDVTPNIPKSPSVTSIPSSKSAQETVQLRKKAAAATTTNNNSKTGVKTGVSALSTNTKKTTTVSPKTTPTTPRPASATTRPASALTPRPATSSTPRPTASRPVRPVSAVSQSTAAPAKIIPRKPVTPLTKSMDVKSKPASPIVKTPISKAAPASKVRPTSTGALSTGFDHNVAPKGEQIKPKVGSMDNKDYKPGGGVKAIFNEKVKINAGSKVGSKDKVDHKPGGGDKKIFSEKVDFTKKVESKVGSMEKKDYKPGGGDKKFVTHRHLSWEKKPILNTRENIDYKCRESEFKIFNEKLAFDEEATPKVQSFENKDYEPRSSNLKIYDEKLPWLEHNKPKVNPSRQESPVGFDRNRARSYDQKVKETAYVSPAKIKPRNFTNERSQNARDHSQSPGGFDRRKQKEYDRRVREEAAAASTTNRASNSNSHQKPSGHTNNRVEKAASKPSDSNNNTTAPQQEAHKAAMPKSTRESRKDQHDKNMQHQKPKAVVMAPPPPPKQSLPTKSSPSHTEAKVKTPREPVKKPQETENKIPEKTNKVVNKQDNFAEQEKQKKSEAKKRKNV